MFFIKMGSLKTVPFKMFLIVPLGDFHIYFKLNSATLASSGVLNINHLKLLLHCGTLDTNLALPNRLSALQSHLVVCLITILHTQIKVPDWHIQKWQYQVILYVLPNYLNIFNNKIVPESSRLRPSQPQGYSPLSWNPCQTETNINIKNIFLLPRL